MEEARNGSLVDILQNKKIELIWPLRLRLFLQIADGLNYLHNFNPKKSFIHKDLKSENILLDKNVMIKIADLDSFNLKYTPGAENTTSIDPINHITPVYAAPELLKNPMAEPSCEMDVYRYYLFYLYIHPTDSQESDGGANT